MSIRDLIKGEINKLNNSLNSNFVNSKLTKAKDDFLAAQAAVYKESGKISGGFKQLTDTLTDVSSNVNGSVPDQITSQLNVVQLDVSANSSELLKDVGSDRSDLSTITGDSRLTQDGFLDLVITIPLPEAIAATLKDVTTLSNSQISARVKENAVSNNTTSILTFDENVFDNIVGNLTGNFKSLTAQLNSSVADLTNGVNSLIAKANSKGFNSLIENVVEEALHPAENLLKDVTNKTIKSEDFKEIMRLKSEGKLKEAAQILKKYSDSDINALINKLSQIDNKASTQVTESTSPQNIRTQRTDNLINLWNESTTAENSQVFSPIQGKEIEAEVLNMQREVTEVIVMFMPVKGATVNRYHAKYAEEYGIGLNQHFYIGYDNVVYRGRPLEIESKNNVPTITNEHYKRSILIGVNIDEKSKTKKLAPGQEKSLIELIRQISAAKPGIQVFSAADVGWITDVNTTPLNVANLVHQKLGKRNLQTYFPKERPPLTNIELANYYIGI